MPGFDLRELGWNDELAENLEPGLVPGRVAAVHRGAFDVWTEAGARPLPPAGPARARGPRRRVGDWVGLADGLIRAVLPRRSAIVRNAAGLATTRADARRERRRRVRRLVARPGLEPRRIERYLVTLWESGAAPEIVLTKADRLDDPWPLVAEVEAVALGVPVHVVSRADGPGLRRAARAHRARRDGRPARLVRRRQVDARQPLARRGGDGDAGDPRRRRRGPPHDHATASCSCCRAAGS